VRLMRKFLEGVGSSLAVDEGRLLRINNRRFTVGEDIEACILRGRSLVYAGKLLGKDRNLFHPSPALLQEVASGQGPLNRVHVDREVGWLFVCGRDIFEESILRREGAFEEGALSLVMLDGECLGYGRVETFEGRRMLRNVFDIGDFLRRERWRDRTT